MIGDILICYVMQIMFTVGAIILFGFLIAACNKKFYSNFGARGQTLCYITGAIGTPVHECAHALMCLVFGHKITKIKLFQINSADGTLGYVNHTYNPKNIYHKIGNFFIGVAPIVVISAILYLLAGFLLPDFVAGIGKTVSADGAVNDIGGTLLGVLSVSANFFTYVGLWQWWVFVGVGMFLALHMTLSKADIRGATSGIAFLLVAVLVADIALGVIGKSLLTDFTLWVLNAASYLLCMLLLGLIVSVVAALSSFFLRFIIK